MFCVYLTCYRGNKLPPFYIGSTSIAKIAANYHGTPTSKQFRRLWADELKHAPNQFKTNIISKCSSRNDALLRERDLQKRLNVIRNPLYVNLAYATGQFINISGCSPETRDKIRANKVGKKRWPHSDATKAKISANNRGKKKSVEHRQNLSVAKTGIKQAQEVIENRREKLRGQRRTPEQCKKISVSLKNPSLETRQHFKSAQRKRHKETLVELKAPDGHIFLGTSLEDLCIEHGLYHTSMMRTLKSQKPLQHGPKKGWQLLSIKRK